MAFPRGKKTALLDRMRDLVLDLQTAGGLARTPDLRGLGHSPHTLSAALRFGIVTRPRIGWLALPEADPIAVRSVSLGGRLASAHALRSYGIWVQQADFLTVHCPPNAARLPQLRNGEHRTHRRLQFPADRHAWRVPIGDALIQLAYETDRDSWLASVDSALHTGAIENDDLNLLGRFVPAAHRRILNQADARAESGNETLARLLLLRAGFAVQVQPSLALIGQVDLVVDEWLIVEVDSKAHHSSTDQQNKDRLRDGNALLTGFATVRLMPEALHSAPDWCLDVIRARLVDGRPQPRSGPVRWTSRPAS